MNPSLKSYATSSTKGLLTVSWNQSVSTAFTLMNEKNLRYLPVIHDNGAIIGILSERDCERAIHVDSVDFFSPRAPQAHFNPDSLVRDFMSWPVEVIDENLTVADAAKLMIAKKISSLLVVSGTDVRGILTSEDLLRVIVEESEIAFAATGTTAAEAQEGDAYQTVKYANSVGSVAQFFASVGL